MSATIRNMFKRQTLLKHGHSGWPCIPSIPFHAKALSNWRILAQKLSNFKWVQVNRKTIWCAFTRTSQICGHLALPVSLLHFWETLGFWNLHVRTGENVLYISHQRGMAQTWGCSGPPENGLFYFKNGSEWSITLGFFLTLSHTQMGHNQKPRFSPQHWVI